MHVNVWFGRHRIWAVSAAAALAVLAVVVIAVIDTAGGGAVSASDGSATADPTPGSQDSANTASGTSGSGGSSLNSGGVTLPPANAAFDYQLGGAYSPPPGVRIVIRDRTADVVPGLYNICYVNGFQTQPDDLAWWRDHHNDLLLTDGSGSYVIDPDWNETLLDISSPAKRTALAAIVGGWIDGCAAKGVQAVELDNLDTWSRSQGLLTRADTLAYVTLLAARAHEDGLAVGQKNAVELAGQGKAAGFDFAIAEECGRYQECDGYTAVYGSRVLVIEYRFADFAYGCSQWGAELAIVLRDRNLVSAGRTGYVYQAC